MVDAHPRTVYVPLLITALLLLSSFLVLVPGEVAALSEGDYEYELTGVPAVAAITKYTGAGGAVIIPATLGGYATTIIRHDAFNYGNGIHVTSVIIPSSVHTVENYAFANCEDLEKVLIGSGVSSIGDATFINCHNLNTILVHDSNLFYSSLDDILYNKTMTALIKCPSAKAGDVTIPDTVTSLRYGSFDDCRSIENLVIGSGVTEIGRYMFESVDDLKTVTFSAGSSLHTIGERAFSACENLESFDAPSGLLTIENEAFQRCKSLVVFDLPSGLESVGPGAFAGCESLVNMTVPASVMEIGLYAFSGCKSIAWFDVESENENFCSIDGVLYNKTATVLMQCPGGKTGNLTIPDSVIEIAMYSVAGCIITGARIGNGVEKIGVYSFYACTKLKAVEMGDSVEIIGGGAFYGCKLLKSIEVPATVTEIQVQAFAECLTLNNITFLGSSAQIEVGADWILHTSWELQGHAPAGSDFPDTGTTYYGLLMGTNVGELPQEKDMTETYLLLTIVLLIAIVVMMVVLLVLNIKRK
ncbi:MAG TPA: leucine-rich repeat domain-containing protein [Methanomassiliicoccales archaeon]|nr:leucine-rich repeat domain-containing protein [Methanomassiliicoccales archaeon]HNX47920.1 leucine-rich repeat domain-containing protein [Methanomassiliicoccales archaeon]HPR97700.1 leucine-rich repeat domain-containing protein [Methanomassiliicoccales archaeon]